jgi:HPt (histidine-containing phosphotransfer) domain-containing protein
LPEVLDQAALDALITAVGDDPDFVDELVDAYLADAPFQEDAIRAALDAGEAEGIVRPAHTLKSTSLSVGGVRVAEVARQIEEHGRAGSLGPVAALLADLEAARGDLAAALERARARRWTSG